MSAVFTRDGLNAFDTLSKYFDPDVMTLPGGQVVPNRILQNFIPREDPDRKAKWSDAPWGELLFRDRRWIQLVKRVRQHPATEYSANCVLEFAKSAAVDDE